MWKLCGCGHERELPRDLERALRGSFVFLEEGSVLLEDDVIEVVVAPGRDLVGTVDIEGPPGTLLDGWLFETVWRSEYRHSKELCDKCFYEY